MTANVKNYIDQPSSGSTDNVYNFTGTINFDSSMTWNIGGVQVTGLAALAEKLNSLESVREVANKSGGDYTAGTLVYINGYDTTLGVPTVAKADADDATKKANLVLTEAIANNASGSAEAIATITGLDTSAAAAVGSLVYESTTAGAFTFTAPTDANDNRRCVGVVVVKDATVGSIDFFPGMSGMEHAAVYLNNITPGTAKANGALIVDANIDVAGVRNLGITGVGTFASPQVLDHNTTITAFAGGGQGSATALTGQYNNVTTVASAYDSVKLLTAVSGQVQTVKNSGANILSVFPNTSDSINALAVNLSVDIPVGGEITFRAISDTVWETVEAINLIAPTTQTGNLIIKASDNAANHEVSITNASHGQATALTIPDGGSATASFLLTKGAQTIDGVQTYTVPQVLDHNTGITAFAGGGQASATALTGQYNDVTTVATAADSVKLPTAVLGQIITVKNSGANILAVFPADADSINALAINLSVDVPVGGEATFRAISDTVWETIESIYVSSPTTQTGGLELKATASAGNTITTVTNASQAAARTYTIPDAGNNASFVMTEGNATVNGTKTFGSAIVVPDVTDHVKFLGLNDVIAFSAGTWTTTRVAQGDYVSRKTAGDNTTIIGIDITEALRTTASRGLKLASFDVIFRNTTANLDAHTVTLDKIAYTDSETVTTTNIAITGTLGTGQDNDPQIDNVVVDTPAYNVTDDSKYVLELTVDAAAGSVYDFIGIMLKFTRNDM